MSSRINQAKRRYIIEIIIVMGVYMLAVLATAFLSERLQPGPALTAVALTPALIMAVAGFVFLRLFRRLDERQQRIQAYAAGATLMAAIIVMTALGFLKAYGVFAHPDDLVWFPPFLIIFWGAARAFMGDVC